MKSATVMLQTLYIIFICTMNTLEQILKATKRREQVKLANNGDSTCKVFNIFCFREMVSTNSKYVLVKLALNVFIIESLTIPDYDFDRIYVSRSFRIRQL